MASTGRARGPVNRRIEGYLSRVMGQRDPAGLIRLRSTEPIRACGLAPRHQAGHMTAIGLRCRYAKNPCGPGAILGPSTHDPAVPATGGPKGVDGRGKPGQDEICEGDFISSWPYNAFPAHPYAPA